METQISKFKLYATLFALGVAGGSIFIIPYIKFVFYDLQLQVTGMTNTQSALLMTVFSVASLVFDVPCGMICDKINSKKGLIFALLATTAVTLLYAFASTHYVVSLLIWVILAFLTMGIYWPIFSKVLNIIGNKTGTAGRSGSSFGWYYAFNGISAAVLEALALWVSTRFEDPVMSFRMAILVAAGSTILATVLIIFLFDSELTAPEAVLAETEKKHSGIELNQLTEVLRNPSVWMMMIICMIAYCMYSMMSYFTPFLTAVVGVSPEASGVFAIIRTYIFLILALVGGLIADKVFKGTTKWIMLVFFVTAVIIGGLFIMPHNANVMLISIYTLIPAALVQMSYPIKYSVIGEIGVKQHLLGTATGLAALAGALPDLVLGPFIGSMLDTRGNDAYYILFGILIVLLLTGCFCCWRIVRKQKAAKLA